MTTISGDSIDSDNFSFYIGVNLFEPLQGFDSRFYSWGSYNPKNFTYNPADKVFYKTS